MARTERPRRPRPNLVERQPARRIGPLRPRSRRAGNARVAHVHARPARLAPLLRGQRAAAHDRVRMGGRRRTESVPPGRNRREGSAQGMVQRAGYSMDGADRAVAWERRRFDDGCAADEGSNGGVGGAGRDAGVPR